MSAKTATAGGASKTAAGGASKTTATAAGGASKSATPYLRHKKTDICSKYANVDITDITANIKDVVMVTLDNNNDKDYKTYLDALNFIIEKTKTPTKRTTFLQTYIKGVLEDQNFILRQILHTDKKKIRKQIQKYNLAIDIPLDVVKSVNPVFAQTATPAKNATDAAQKAVAAAVAAAAAQKAAADATAKAAADAAAVRANQDAATKAAAAVQANKDAIKTYAIKWENYRDSDFCRFVDQVSRYLTGGEDIQDQALNQIDLLLGKNISRKDVERAQRMWRVGRDLGDAKNVKVGRGFASTPPGARARCGEWVNPARMEELMKIVETKTRRATALRSIETAIRTSGTIGELHKKLSMIDRDCDIGKLVRLLEKNNLVSKNSPMWPWHPDRFELWSLFDVSNRTENQDAYTMKKQIFQNVSAEMRHKRRKTVHGGRRRSTAHAFEQDEAVNETMRGDIQDIQFHALIYKTPAKDVLSKLQQKGYIVSKKHFEIHPEKDTLVQIRFQQRKNRHYYDKYGKIENYDGHRRQVSAYKPLMAGIEDILGGQANTNDTNEEQILTAFFGPLTIADLDFDEATAAAPAASVAQKGGGGAQKGSGESKGDWTNETKKLEKEDLKSDKLIKGIIEKNTSFYDFSGEVGFSEQKAAVGGGASKQGFSEEEAKRENAKKEKLKPYKAEKILINYFDRNNKLKSQSYDFVSSGPGNVVSVTSGSFLTKKNHKVQGKHLFSVSTSFLSGIETEKSVGKIRDIFWGNTATPAAPPIHFVYEE